MAKYAIFTGLRVVISYSQRKRSRSAGYRLILPGNLLSKCPDFDAHASSNTRRDRLPMRATPGLGPLS